MPIRIITKRGTEIGSLPNFSRGVKLAYIGISGGEKIIVNSRTEDEKFSFIYDDSTTLGGDSEFIVFVNNFAPALNQTGFNLLNITSDPNDQFNVYIKDIDWSYNSTTQKIIWTDNPIGPPELEVSVVAQGGTGLNGRDYYYKIVAFADGTGATSLPSQVVKVDSNSSSTISHKFSWNKVAHAQGYIIYDSTANKRITIIANPNTTSYTRTTGTGTNVTIPSTVTAFRKPVEDSNGNIFLYVDYEYIQYNFDINNFTSLNQVQKSHGIGSDLTNMARIAFQQFNVPEMYIIATDGTTNQAFIDAIDKVKNIEDVQYITALKDSTTVSDYVVTHATNQSTDNEQKERFGVVHIPNNQTLVGDEDTAGTIRYRLASFNGERRAIIVVPNGNVVYMNTYQETDGSFTDNKLVPNYFIAGAVSAAAITAEDVATSLINREIPGFNFGPNGAPWIDSIEKNKIEDSGGMYIYSRNGRMVIYNDNTNDTSQTENAERSVLSAEDEMRRRLRRFHQQYLGRKITQGLIAAIYSTTSSVLKQMVSDVLINSFNEGSLEVNQDETIKTKVNVTFSYASIYPLKELVFSYSFEL